MSDSQKKKVDDMKTETIYEQTIISIMQGLPYDRILQLIDFAKFLENQSAVNKADEEKAETGENIRAKEEKWNKLFADTEAKLMMREMANEALEDYRAGKTTEMTITRDGRLEPV